MELLEPKPQRADRTWLVATAAALWGTDALFRRPLAEALPAPTVVFYEHAIVVLVLLPTMGSALGALRRLSWMQRSAAVGIGAGASAAATVLFTMAFRVGDPLTPLVLQKLQPLIAIAGAALLLGERLHGRYLIFAVPALAGAWLLTFRNPLDVSLASAKGALLSLGAAALWAAGTVLGRFLGGSLDAVAITKLRFLIGLPTSLLLAVLARSPLAVPLRATGPLIALALVPGLFALLLYYRGLRRTPAARATLGELAFPATAAVVGIFVLGVRLTGSQWLGALLVVGSVAALGLHERTSAEPAVAPSRPPRLALSEA